MVVVRDKITDMKEFSKLQSPEQITGYDITYAFKYQPSDGFVYLGKLSQWNMIKMGQMILQEQAGMQV